MSGKGIGISIQGTWAVCYSKIKAREEQGPSCLPVVESFGGSQIFKVAVIGQNGEGVFSSLKPVTPFLEGCFHGEKFSVAHIVVLFSRVEFTGVEGTGVSFVRVSLSLGENCSNACAGCINLHDEL